MKRIQTPIFWFLGVLFVYVLGSGPAILIERGPAGGVVDVIFLPLTYVASYTPAYRVLLPYWQFWMDKAGVEGCPFLFG